jgi:hypothetical protein
MMSSVMLHRVALVRKDVSEERIVSISRATRIDELGTNSVFFRSVIRLLVTANFPSLPIPVALMMEAIRSFETPVL